MPSSDSVIVTTSGSSTTAAGNAMRIAGENGSSNNPQHQQVGPLSPTGSSVASNSSAGMYNIYFFHILLYCLSSTAIHTGMHLMNLSNFLAQYALELELIDGLYSYAIFKEVFVQILTFFIKYKSNLLFKSTIKNI